jgi:long-chain fatty acid transport protein
MPNYRRPALFLAAAALAATALLAPGSASASGFFRFQHGGRATGQVGAFTARADDPGAIFYDPAAITHLPGLQLQAGLDFNNATDNYESSTAGKISAAHIIDFPPSVYVTYNSDRLGPWAFGLGVDTPYWQKVNWDSVFFAPRQLARRMELYLFEVHPVAAYRIDDHWSVGGGLRYDFGSFKQGVNTLPREFDLDGTPFTTEVLLDSSSNVDGLGFDAGVHYTTAVWGWGAVYRSAVTVNGGGDLARSARDLPADSALSQALTAQLVKSPISQSVHLPAELRGGAWIAPYPELRLELDLAYQAWSDFEQSVGGSGAPGAPVSIVQRGGWDDTVAIRLAVEGDVTDAVTLYGGVAFEPTPVPKSRVDPGFSRGDATVYALGVTYNFPQISFDLGYSRHQHASVGSDFQELASPGVSGTYTARDSVWSASARWRF